MEESDNLCTSANRQIYEEVAKEQEYILTKRKRTFLLPCIIKLIIFPHFSWVSGPGCSSVGYGATQEIGPFLVDTNGLSLKLNPFAWNKGKWLDFNKKDFVFIVNKMFFNFS